MLVPIFIFDISFFLKNSLITFKRSILSYSLALILIIRFFRNDIEFSFTFLTNDLDIIIGLFHLDDFFINI